MIRMSSDHRQGVHNNETVVENIKLANALDSIKVLDGNVHTLVMLDRSDGWQLMVGGGPSHFIVTLGNTDENLTLHNEDGDPANEMEICAGGQYGDYPEIICANGDQSIVAVTAFFARQEKNLIGYSC